jgi:flagellar basal-body rod protein FlgF
MSGAKQTLQAQAANSHNLANVSTTAFKADLSAFRSMPVFGPGNPTRVFAMQERPGTDFKYGTITHTGRDLDVAVKGDGWLAVQDQNQQEAYTRAGELRVTTTGSLLTADDQPVLGNSGPIAIPPADKIEIAADGTISILPRGQSGATLAIVDRIKLVKPDLAQLEKSHDGLMRMRPGLPPAVADGNVRLVSGALESSNVNAVDAMVNMITLARQFEMQVKMMQTAQQNDAASNELLRIG